MFNWILNTSLKPVDNFFVSRHFTMLYKCSEGLLVLSELCGSRLKVEIEIQNIVFLFDLFCFLFLCYPGFHSRRLRNQRKAAGW